VLEDLLNELISILDQIVLELRAIQDDELLRLLRLLVLNVVSDIDETID
jgi:hypothetical protein